MNKDKVKQSIKFLEEQNNVWEDRISTTRENSAEFIGRSGFDAYENEIGYFSKKVEQYIKAIELLTTLLKEEDET